MIAIIFESKMGKLAKCHGSDFEGPVTFEIYSHKPLSFP